MTDSTTPGIATRAVQVKHGWAAQVTVGEEIVWQGAAHHLNAAQAEEEARFYIFDRLKRLMTEPHPNDPIEDGE